MRTIQNGLWRLRAGGRVLEDIRLSSPHSIAEAVPAIGERFNVRAVPTLILFKDGEDIGRRNGFQSASMLSEWITPHVAD